MELIQNDQFIQFVRQYFQQHETRMQKWKRESKMGQKDDTTSANLDYFHSVACLGETHPFSSGQRTNKDMQGEADTSAWQNI